nr:AGE family epimerase/isomerase [Paraglaciecola arctica]
MWTNCGINPQNGSVYEQLCGDGFPDHHANMRSRVQSRQIFVFSCAQIMGWSHDKNMTVDKIQHFLDKHARTAPNSVGYAHLLDPNGRVLEQKKDTYDFAFFLLASAYQFKAFGKSTELKLADQYLEHIESKFKGKFGGWQEGDYPSEFRRQNPHMHLFEAFLTWFDISKDPKWLAKAGQVFTLFESCFFDHDVGVVREHFEQDWTLACRPMGNIIEPGHMFEWVWLLRWYQKLTGTDVSGYCNTLFDKAIKIGLFEDTCLVFDQVEHDGQVIKSSKRLWPITELIKASIAQAEANREQAQEYELLASKGIQTLFDFYFCMSQSTAIEGPTANSAIYDGRYIDQLDEENNIAVNLTPASTLYHIVMATIVGIHYVKSEQNSPPRIS